MSEANRRFSLVAIMSMVVVGLVVVGAISYFIAAKVMSDQVTDKKLTREPGVFVKVSDNKDGGLIINVAGPNSGRYLKVNIMLEMKKENLSKDAKLLPADEIKVLDTVIYNLRMQKIEDFDPAKQDMLKDLLKNEINKVLGGDRVLQVYITNFVLQ